MSGGHFDYKQYQISMIIDELQEVINNNKVEKTKEQLHNMFFFYNTEDADAYFEKYPELKLHSNYSDEVIEEFKRGLHYLKLAYIYTQRIDLVVSGDESEEAFFKRLKEELKELTLNSPIDNEHLERLALDYEPRPNLDAEFLRAAFKQGYLLGSGRI